MQPFGCQVKAPEWRPFHSSTRQLLSPSGMHVCVFSFLPLFHQTFIRWTLEAVCPFYLPLIFRCLRRAASPWIFILPLTPLNVNSSFPVLLFISGTGWFDHAGNTRLAIALSLLSPPRTSAPEMLLFVLLNPLRTTSFLTFDIFLPSFLTADSEPPLFSASFSSSLPRDVCPSLRYVETKPKLAKGQLHH